MTVARAAPIGATASVMRAWSATAYGGPEVLALRELPLPHPGAAELLIRVQATTVSSADRRIRSMDFPPGLKTLGRLLFGLRRPRRSVLGGEATGVVVAVGAKVGRFTTGDAVIAVSGARLGAHAEYLRIAETATVVPRAAGIPIEVAAALGFGGLTARDYLRRAALRPQERLLVIGGAGAVGSALVQLGVVAGAQVTAITSTGNLALMGELGADHALDYTDPRYRLDDQRFDVIADAVGVLDFARACALLAEGGRFLAINGGVGDMLARSRRGLRCIAGPAAERRDDLEALQRLCEQGRYRPLVDSAYAFDELPQAHRRVDSGRKRGSVVVHVDARP